MINYQDYAVRPVGTEPPTEPYSRGGFLGGGRLSTYYSPSPLITSPSVMSVWRSSSGPNLGKAEKIKEVSQRADLPK